MPELPEVETIRRDIMKDVFGYTITSVTVHTPTSINLSETEFKKLLIGNNINDIQRKGKYLAIKLESGMWIAIHLKMSGQLIVRGNSQSGHGYSYNNPEQLPHKHTRVSIYFSNGAVFYFNDMRRFGYMHLISEQEKEKQFARIGKDLLNENVDFNFLQNRKTTVKAAILQQNVVSGIGNIYADEICFSARILPDRNCNTLTELEIDLIAKEAKRIIKEAVSKRGTSFGLYVDGKGEKGNYKHSLQVYLRAGEPCYVCSSPIIKTRVAGRGTHYCKNCQL